MFLSHWDNYIGKASQVPSTISNRLWYRQKENSPNSILGPYAILINRIEFIYARRQRYIIFTFFAFSHRIGPIFLKVA